MPKQSRKAIQKVTPEELTKAGEKLLIALSDAENYKKTITELCQVAEISRMQYYRLYRDPKFIEKAIDLAKKIFAWVTPAVSHRVALDALNGSLTHQRMILEATGIIQPVNTIPNLTQVNVITKPEDLKDDQLTDIVA